MDEPEFATATPSVDPGLDDTGDERAGYAELSPAVARHVDVRPLDLVTGAPRRTEATRSSTEKLTTNASWLVSSFTSALLPPPAL